MKKALSVHSYFRSRYLRSSVWVGLLILIISAVLTLFLVRRTTELELLTTMHGAAHSFRNTITQGDVTAAERQIRESFHLMEEERILVLGPNKTPILRVDALPEGQTLNMCKREDTVCFHGMGQASIFVPIYFDDEHISLSNYLYLSKQVHFDWFLFLEIFGALLASLLIFCCHLAKITDKIFAKISGDISTWSSRLKLDPKNPTPLGNAPFSELGELKNAIETLSMKIKEFEEGAAEKSQLLLLRGLGHDLINPVGQMQMFLATLKLEMSSLTEKQKTAISKMSLSLLKIGNLASQVKMLLRHERDLGSANLFSCIKKDIDLLKLSPKVLEKRVNIVCEKLDLPGTHSVLSEGEVTRVVQNLIENAADASAEGSTIKITGAESDQDISFSVEDEGCGIPDNLKQKVFDPDFTSKPGTGTGLGLFTVKWICEQKNGRVLLESNTCGTRVTVRVPKVQEVLA